MSSFADGSARPRILVRQREPIWSFAQDGAVLAWETRGRYDTRSKIKVRGARDGRAAVVAELDGIDGPYNFDQFTLSGRRVLWAGFVDCCDPVDGTVGTAAPGSKPRELASPERDWSDWVDFPTGAAGDRGTLVYSMVSEEAFFDSNDQVDFWAVRGGDTSRVVGARQRRVPGAPPAALLAAARQVIALVPASRERSWSGFPEVTVPENAQVEIRDVITGAERATFTPRGQVTALAMDSDTVAVIVRSGKRARIEWYATRTGNRRGAVSVSPKIADWGFDISGHVVVLHVGRTIFALDTTNRTIRTLARARATPIGLSIEGARVAWADNNTIGAVIVR